MGPLTFSGVSLPSLRTTSQAFSRLWLRLSNMPALTRRHAPRCICASLLVSVLVSRAELDCTENSSNLT